MFSTSRSRRHHQQQQRESSPPPGSDSCYGVRSLEGSVCNDSIPSLPTASSPLVREARYEEDKLDGDDEYRSEAGEGDRMTPTTDPSNLPPSPARFMSISAAPLADNNASDLAPPSPDDTLHPLDRGRNDGRDSRAELNHRLSLAYLQSPGSNYHDTSSVPSSPASVSFSCIASLSSVSRTSSPVSGRGYAGYRSMGMGEEQGEDDLVLPTLSLPSSSLHMSLQRAIMGLGGTGGGIKIALVGDNNGKVLDALGYRHGWELRKMGSGSVTEILRDGKVTATVLEAAIDIIQQRVNDGYAALDALLHPDLPMEKEEEVRKLVRDYASRNDWVHAVVVLKSSHEAAASLEQIMPIISLDPNGPSFFSLQSSPSENESRAPTPSPPRLGDDPTPMPSLEQAESYFPRSATSSSDDGVHQDRAIDIIARTIDSQAAIVEASIDKFIAWRGNNVRTPLHSSFTSTTPSSAGYAAQPMPTVARASGGGEWEANLSRRLAGAHARERERRSKGRPKRKDERDVEKAKRMERDRGCGPIFPRGKGSKAGPQISRLGLGQLWESVFGVSGATKTGWFGWKWGLTMAAAVLVVGWGCWVKVR